VRRAVGTSSTGKKNNSKTALTAAVLHVIQPRRVHIYTHYPPVHMRGTMKPPNNSYYAFRSDAIMRPKHHYFFYFFFTHADITILYYYNVVFVHNNIMLRVSVSVRCYSFRMCHASRRRRFRICHI